MFHDRDNDGVRDLTDTEAIPDALVFADLNENGVFDFEEPVAASGLEGAYELTLTVRRTSLRGELLAPKSDLLQ